MSLRSQKKKNTALFVRGLPSTCFLLPCLFQFLLSTCTRSSLLSLLSPSPPFSLPLPSPPSVEEEKRESKQQLSELDREAKQVSQSLEDLYADAIALAMRLETVKRRCSAIRDEGSCAADVDCGWDQRFENPHANSAMEILWKGCEIKRDLLTSPLHQEYKEYVRRLYR